MTRLLAIVSEQGTACYEACLCERCHADPKHRAAAEAKAARTGDIPNPADWQDATGNDALTCNVCGYPKLLLCPSTFGTPTTTGEALGSSPGLPSDLPTMPRR
jgi:hypothetical protein